MIFISSVSGGAIARMSVGIILLILLVLLMFAVMILVYALRRQKKKRIKSKLESVWIPDAHDVDFALEFNNPHYNDEHYVGKEDML